MDLTILVPRRPDNGWRDRLWRHCRQPLEGLGWPIHEGTHDDDGTPFNRARAINQAARLAGSSWTVAVILDADVLVPLDQLDFAVQLATDRQRLTFAYDRRRNLNRNTTKRILNGWPVDIDRRDAPNTHVQTDLPLWPESPSCSSALAVTRELFETVGGYDERFQGWGWEDVAFHRSAITLGGDQLAVGGDALHLWHPRPTQRVEKPPQFYANQQLGERYKAALGDPDAIRALIAERAGEPT